MSYGKDLIKDLEKELKGLKLSAKNRAERINRGEIESSDCFLSEWANSKSQDIVYSKLAILNNKGKSKFRVLADLEGNVVADKPIKTRYGNAWKVPLGWVSTSLKKETLEKKGYKEIWVKKDAWVNKEGNIFPSNINYWKGK